MSNENAEGVWLQFDLCLLRCFDKRDNILGSFYAQPDPAVWMRGTRVRTGFCWVFIYIDASQYIKIYSSSN